MRSDLNSVNNTKRTRQQFTESNNILDTRSFQDNTTFLVKSNLVTPLNSERLHYNNNNNQNALKSQKVPKSFWKDIYGQENSYFVVQANTNLLLKRKQEGEKIPQKYKQSNAEQAIREVNRAVSKLRSLRQFKSLEMAQKVENKSENSMDEKHQKKDESFEFFHKKNSLHNTQSIGRSLMRSTQATWNMQSKNETAISKLEQTIQTLMKTHNIMSDEAKQKQIELQSLKQELQKLMKGGSQKENILLEKLSEQQMTEKKIKLEDRKLQETTQENHIIYKMLQERKQDISTMYTPYLMVEKKLKVMENVIANQSDNLALEGRDIEELRGKIQQEEFMSDNIQTQFKKQITYKHQMLKKEKIIKQTYLSCISKSQQVIFERECQTSKIKQEIQLAEEDQAQKFQEEQKRKSELECTFQSLNGVILNNQKPEEFGAYFWKLQEDKRLMLEQCSNFYRKIDTTKEEIQEIQLQILTIQTQRLELNEDDKVEMMLENHNLIQQLDTELAGEKQQIDQTQAEVQKQNYPQV